VIRRAWNWYVGDVLGRSFRLVRRHGGTVSAEAQVPRWRQLATMVWLSTTLPTPPGYYYKFELYRSAQRKQAMHYLYNFETKAVLFELLGKGGPAPDEAPPLEDKLRFSAHAQLNGLAAIPTIAELTDGDIDAEIPRRDLFVKPRHGQSGRSAMAWTYRRDNDTYQLVGTDKAVDRSELTREIMLRAGRQPMLVQPRLSSHGDIAGLALDAVPTCRVVTIIDETGQPEPVLAVFRMPSRPSTVVDDVRTGAIAAAVDLSSGRLTSAASLNRSSYHRFARHPHTSAPIEDAVLPDWPSVLRLASDGHRCFPSYVFVSWDVALTPDGPTLIEGNATIGVDALQRVHLTPLGNHRFGQLLARHLRDRVTKLDAAQPLP
jgi:hypothetical protein